MNKQATRVSWHWCTVAIWIAACGSEPSAGVTRQSRCHGRVVTCAELRTLSSNEAHGSLELVQPLDARLCVCGCTVGLVTADDDAFDAINAISPGTVVRFCGDTSVTSEGAEESRVFVVQSAARVREGE